METTFEFAFEELPLIAVEGFTAALVDGSATVTGDPSGWRIEAVKVQVEKGRQSKFIPPPAAVAERHPVRPARPARAMALAH